MSNYFNFCPNCGNKNTSVLGLKDPLYECKCCGGKCCSKCKTSDNRCPNCAEKSLVKLGLIK
jgi:DNA-directed RNA polymerase subunit RPC12/RpoP